MPAMAEGIDAAELRDRTLAGIGELLLVSQRWRREVLSEQRPDPDASQPGSVREAAATTAVLIDANPLLWGDYVKGYQAVLPLLQRSAQLAGDVESHYAEGKFGQGDEREYLHATMRELGRVEMRIREVLPAFYLH